MKKFSFLNIVADEQDIDIYISGEIVSDDIKELYDYFGVQSTAPSGFKQLLAEHKGKNLTVHINSLGGDVFAGVEIYNALMDYKGNTTAVIDGVAASAATLPMVACTNVKMSASSVIMIHCASMAFTSGNRYDLKKDIEVLKTIDNAIANAYEIKTSKDREELLKLMANETWMDAKEAKQLGFVDEIDNRLVLPDNVIENIKDNKKAMVASMRDLYISNARHEWLNKQPPPPAPKDSQPTNEVVYNTAEFEFIQAKLKLI